MKGCSLPLAVFICACQLKEWWETHSAFFKKNLVSSFFSVWNAQKGHADVDPQTPRCQGMHANQLAKGTSPLAKWTMIDWSIVMVWSSRILKMFFFFFLGLSGSFYSDTSKKEENLTGGHFYAGQDGDHLWRAERLALFSRRETVPHAFHQKGHKTGWKLSIVCNLEFAAGVDLHRGQNNI